jgi:hypothetical protein
MPELACRTPVPLPTVREPVVRFVVLAVVAAKFVVVALVKVALVATSVVDVRDVIVPTALSIALLIVPVMMDAATDVGELPPLDTLWNDVAFAFAIASNWRCTDAASAEMRAST